MQYTSVRESDNLLWYGVNVSTADMCYRIQNRNGEDIYIITYDKPRGDCDIPAWSYGKLLYMLSKKGVVSTQCLNNDNEPLWRFRFNINDIYVIAYGDTFGEGLIKLYRNILTKYNCDFE